MTDWDAYAERQPHLARAYEAEPVQMDRAQSLPARCVGSVLDVGSSDGFITALIARSHPVIAFDIAYLRADRARKTHNVLSMVGDANHLPFADGSFDTVVLAEILEHLDNPGPALGEAARVARERVIVTLPLNGWADPTHRWRISLDQHEDRHQHTFDPTRGQQITLTMQRGDCWPNDYWKTDPSWREQFGGTQ